MSFIGVFIENRKENEVKQLLKKYFFSNGENHTVITINRRNVDNMKNVKFDVVVLENNMLGMLPSVQRVILNAKVILVNTDLEENLKLVRNMNLRIISYGLNSKATVTVSSTNEEYALISLQRSVKTLKDNIIEPQEAKIIMKNCHNNLNIAMILVTFSIIFNKI